MNTEKNREVLLFMEFKTHLDATGDESFAIQKSKELENLFLINDIESYIKEFKGLKNADFHDKLGFLMNLKNLEDAFNKSENSSLSNTDLVRNCFNDAINTINLFD